MPAMLGLRGFALAPRGSGGVSCDDEGVFVGSVPLLQCSRRFGNTFWTARRIDDLNADLTVLYGLPVDATAKTNAMALIAAALNHGDLAMAAIAAVQMQFPDPPKIAGAEETNDQLWRSVAELCRSGLLKADWDPAKHPRTGTPPNRGWFAPVPREAKTPPAGWPLRHVNVAARKAFAEAIEGFGRYGKYLFLGLPLADGILAFVDAYSPTELNRGEDRLTAQLLAALQQPAESLEALQHEPSENILGYELHHIVESNPDNLQKGQIGKFGQSML